MILESLYVYVFLAVLYGAVFSQCCHGSRHRNEVAQNNTSRTVCRVAESAHSNSNDVNVVTSAVSAISEVLVGLRVASSPALISLGVVQLRNKCTFYDDV